MLIEDLLGKASSVGVGEIHLLQQQCSQFMDESEGLSVFRALPITYLNFQKVKVRQHKKSNVVAETFNKAFNEYRDLSQRAVFAYGHTEILNLTEHTEPFYVFPINGYKYLYSKEVKNSNANYQEVLNTLFERLEDTGQAIEIVTDLLKYTYVRNNLAEGITSDSEIIFYGIPYYYAMRVSAVSLYDKSLSQS